ncbi:MAG: hypothetical protein R3F54_23320 [Alphaproteobacteria bacterium]
MLAYDEPEAVGFWRPTPLDFKPALVPHCRQATPFAIEQLGQYAVAPPPAADSLQYAQDLREVFEREGGNSTSRSEALRASMAAPQ